MEKEKFVSIVYLDDDAKEYNYDLKVTIYAEGAITQRTADLQKKGRNVRITCTAESVNNIKSTFEKRDGYTFNPNLRW